MTTTHTCYPPATSTAKCPPDDTVLVGLEPDWWSASALFRDETGRHELQVALDQTGRVSATLFGQDVDGFGNGTATLFPVSRFSVTCSVLADLTGYDCKNDRFRHAEAAIGVTWTVDRANPRSVEVAGTALVTDLDDHTLLCYRAVRRHPFNRLDLAALPSFGDMVTVEETPAIQPLVKPRRLGWLDSKVPFHLRQTRSNQAA